LAGKSTSNRRNNNNTIEKQCTVCGGWFAENIDNFYMCNKKKPEMGFVAQCKTCCVKMNADRQYRKYHDGNLKEYYDKMYVEKRDDLLNYQNGYYRNHEKRRVAIKQYGKKYRNVNREEANQYNRFRHMHHTHDITNKEWESCKKYFNHRCAYCGLAIENHYIEIKGETFLGDFHKDHVDHLGSNGLENCIPACKSCNCSKHTDTLDEWYNENNPNFTQERYDRIEQWMNSDYKKYIHKKN